MTTRQQGGGEDDEGDQRQPPVLVEGDADQADQGHCILAERNPGVGYCPPHLVDVDQKAGDQSARVGILKEFHIHARQLVEQTVLIVGDDAEPHISHQRRLSVVGQTFDDEHGEHCQAHGHQHGFVAIDEDIVDHRFHQPSAGRRRRRHQRHAGKCSEEPARVAAHAFAEQPAEQACRGGVDGGMGVDGGRHGPRVLPKVPGTGLDLLPRSL